MVRSLLTLSNSQAVTGRTGVGYQGSHVSRLLYDGPWSEGNPAPSSTSTGLLLWPCAIWLLTRHCDQTSSRPRNEIPGGFSSRRGHASQLSISDPSHHVTEAIGTLYGDEDDSGSEGGRPLSFVGGSSYSEQLQRSSLLPEPHEQDDFRQASRRRSVPHPSPDSPTSPAEHGSLNKTHTLHTPSFSQRTGGPHKHGAKSSASPTLSLRDMQADSTGSQFPLTNIDNPSDIAQELSNLQALRRLSMDVGNYIDPDMPHTTLVAMPAVAPRGDDDENDPSRLLWVPARVHPELAPTEFKSFLEKRVQSIRRRSGDSFLAVDGDPSSGLLSLRRNKSTLSRQIDNTGGRGAIDYVDGAERLERHRSSGSQHSPELSLDELARDPTRAVQRLAQESQGASRGIEGSADDMPILPVAPGKGLRRSTRTTYRKGGSFRSGDRGSHPRRLMQRQSDSDYPETRSTSPPEGVDALPPARVQPEPTAENHPRPARPARGHNNLSKESLPAMSSADGPSETSFEPRSSPHARHDQLPGRTHTNATSRETPMLMERPERPDSQNAMFPHRSSSQDTRSSRDQYSEVVEEASTRSTRRPANSTVTKQHSQPQYSPKSPNTMQMQTANDTLASPSSLSGGDASRTDNLTFIPTLTQPEQKPDKRSKKDRDDDSASTSSRSGSAWKWFKGVTDDREKKKDESRKSKTRAAAEKSQDNVRLDVIQTSIDKNHVKGRESLVLDRENADSKLTEERKRESNRKSDSKKDKDGSIFSSIFGGSKRKEDKEKVNKKNQHLQVPEDIPYKPLTPDVDYNWTRFPLLEERAIYRMAHIKLANPRRSLLSQVLLSNFMYSYLAIVQAMHPQMNVPTSPQQKRLGEGARRRRQEQEYLARQQMQGDQDADNSLDHYNLDYHRATVQYAESDGQVDYVDDARIYEDAHGDERHEDYGYEGIEGYSRDTKDQQHTRDSGDDHRRHGQDDMW
ncbi:Sporulation protein Zds1 [Ophiocordyceps sinensis CO18]|uniref:Sporulation protein Zds1 n=1 Tax=Ophiocordyceps sinensis (strain Co18 / CGMCC 3.14243) TaxID=911162 RepID=T5AM52_OPHSC|nr:Sporulation protein Zds1 [Ophiocordyceps sinensis CO18]